jgi:hypothetical protein
MHQEKHRIRMSNMGSNPASRCKSLTWMYLALGKIEIKKFAVMDMKAAKGVKK